MPLLLVTPSWTRDGGVGAHVIESVRALVARGLDVHVLAVRIDPRESSAGVTLHHAPALFDSHRSPAERVGEVLGTRFSAIHLHQFDDPLVTEYLQRHAPVLISVHGFVACTSRVHYFRPGHECTRAHGPGCVPNLLLRGCAHARDPRHLPGSYRRSSRALQALLRADLAISHSSAVDRHLAVNGVSRRAIVPLFSTLDAHPEAPPATRRRVLFAGRLVRSKGAEVLVRAVRDVDCELAICGEGPRLPAIRRLVSRLGLTERVSFKGWLAQEPLARELAAAAVVAIPSLWPEPFGLVGIESFACARPVVASATGGIPDWLQDGVNGISVPPGDEQALAGALRELLDDPDRARQMGRAGERMAGERFSADRHVAALLDAYHSAGARWRSPGAGVRPQAPSSSHRSEPSRT
ncbi:MAG TPA: glycosyltransferase family 4 protein [Solirubrobacteraceae bacterium]|nr:glycosyltransferase family 4 protein [Solirubrobacteraceae bacterium]